jgi:hypothetical protein
MSSEASAKLLEARMRSLHHIEDDLNDYLTNLSENDYVVVSERMLYSLQEGALVEDYSIFAMEAMTKIEAQRLMGTLPVKKARVVTCREIVQSSIHETTKIIARLNKMG